MEGTKSENLFSQELVEELKFQSFDPSGDEPKPFDPKSVNTRKGMEEIKEKRETMREFWRLHKEKFLAERSIKKIYEAYEALYADKAINEYIFREYIRKPENGYCNSCGGEKKCKRCVLAAMSPEERDAERERRRVEKKERHAELKKKREEKKRLIEAGLLEKKKKKKKPKEEDPDKPKKDKKNKRQKQSKYPPGAKNPLKYSKEGRELLKKQENERLEKMRQLKRNRDEK